MRLQSLLLVSIIGLTACKTANFKGDTGAGKKANSPTEIGTVESNNQNPTPAPVLAPPGSLPTSDNVATKPEVAPAGATPAATPAGPTPAAIPAGATAPAGNPPSATPASQPPKTPEGPKTTVVKNPDGSVTTITALPDGTKTSSTTSTDKNGTVTVVTIGPDGKKITTVTSTKTDGTVTITTTNADGTKTTVVKTPMGTSPGQTPPPTFVECPEFPDHMLMAGLYRIPEKSDKVPNFATITKKKDVCLKQLDVTDREFTEGFPGISNLVEWFALDINWRVEVPAAGDYTFYLNSDDGSYLYIDGILVINNDGLHPHVEKESVARIPKGIHNFRVTWYQGPRYRIALELFWKRPGANKREYIPVQYFSRPNK